jgi:hypothetical protein
LAGAGDARFEHADLALPLGLQQIVVGSDLVGFDQVRIVKRRDGEIGRERIDEAVRLNVVFPHMTTPPLLGVANFRQNDIIHKRRQHVVIAQRLQRPRAAVQHVEVFYPGLEFGDRSLSVLRSRRREQFQFDAEAAFESFFELFTQHCGGRAAGNDFVFLLGSINDAAPFLLGIGAGGDTAPCDQCNNNGGENTGIWTIHLNELPKHDDVGALCACSVAVLNNLVSLKKSKHSGFPTTAPRVAQGVDIFSRLKYDASAGSR